MPVNRIAAFLRPILAYRVEACFLAALVFTLARQAGDHRPRVEVRTATTHHTVVHEVTPVRIASTVGVREIIQRRSPAGVAVIAPDVRVITGSADRKVVVRSHSAASDACVSEAAAGTAGRTHACTIVRVAPATAPAIAKAFVNGS